MSWTVRLSRRSHRAIARMGGKDRRLVLAALDSFRKNPFQGDVLRLTGRPREYRRRTGRWRIFFKADTDSFEVFVAAIRRRTATTYKRS